MKAEGVARIYRRRKERERSSAIKSMCSKFKRDQAFTNVHGIRQIDVLFGDYLAEHDCAMPACNDCADGRSDVVITRSDICNQGEENVEGRLIAHLYLLVESELDLVEGNVVKLRHHRQNTEVPSEIRKSTET